MLGFLNTIIILVNTVLLEHNRTAVYAKTQNITNGVGKEDLVGMVCG